MGSWNCSWVPVKGSNPYTPRGRGDDRVREAVAGRMEGSDGAPRRSFTYGELWDESDAYVVGWGVQQATCSGYFKKENAKTFGFTKRWYKLQGNVLLYYENEHKSKAKGVIDVSAAAICIAAVCARCVRAAGACVCTHSASLRTGRLTGAHAAGGALCAQAQRLLR